MLRNKYSGMSLIDSSGMERDFSRRGKLKGSARVDPRRGLGSIGASSGAASGSSGFASGMRGRMSSARASMGQRFRNASARAFIGGTNLMNSAESGARSAAGRMAQGVRGRMSGAFNVNMSGFGSTSGTAYGPLMNRTLGSSARPALGAGASTSSGGRVSQRRIGAINKSLKFSFPGPSSMGPIPMGQGYGRVGQGQINAINQNLKTQPIRGAFEPNAMTINGRQPLGYAAGERPSAQRLATINENLKNFKTPVAVGAGKAGGGATDDAVRMGKRLMGMAKKHPILAGAGVIGMGAFLGGREKRGTSSGARGAYR